MAAGSLGEEDAAKLRTIAPNRDRSRIVPGVLQAKTLLYMALRVFWWVDLSIFHSSGKLAVRIFSLRYSSSRRP